MTSTTRPAVTTCFAGGGAFGYGFHMGVADGMRAGGVDLRRWPMMGTSAGSHAVATIATGQRFDTIADIWGERVEASPPRLFADGHPFVEAMYGGHRPDAAADPTAVAVRLWRYRRERLSASDHDLDEIVAASCALLPIMRPHRIDRKRYIDGGAISMASADLAPGADVLLLVTPFVRRDQGLAGRIGRWQARREIRTWTDRHGGDVLHVVPSAEMAALGGRRLREVVDIELGRAVYPLACELGGHVARAVLEDRPLLAA